MTRSKTLTVLAAATTALIALGAAAPAFAHGDETHQPVAAAPSTPDTRAVVAVLNQYAAAISANRIDDVKPLLAPGNDFSFFEGTYVNVGWQSYHDHMAPEMKLFKDPSYRFTDIRPYASGNLAYATFSWAMDVTVVSKQFDGGQHPVSMQGKGTVVLSRIGNDWKIRHLQTAMASKPRNEGASH